MKAALVLFVICLTFVSASAVEDEDREELPPGFSSANELAQVLANEPASAAENRFAQTQSSGDAISFRDSGSGSSPSSYGSDDSSDDDAEYDAQISQVDQDIKKIRAQIKESQECARRLTEQQSELRSLQEQRDHLEKEKERHQLQMKLDRQMRDLAEINRMSRALRNKFTELKRTQQLIKTKLTGTRTSLNQLDAEPDVSYADLNKDKNEIASEIDTMQAAEQALLARSHTANTKEVKSALQQANQAKENADRESFNA